MDMMIFTLFWVFGWVILLLVAWHLKSSRRERRLELQHKERMMAMEKGIPLPELPAQDEEPARGRPLLAEVVAAIRINPRWPLGLGALFVMFGIGLSAALALSQERRALPGLVLRPDPGVLRPRTDAPLRADAADRAALTTLWRMSPSSRNTSRPATRSCFARSWSGTRLGSSGSWPGCSVPSRTGTRRK